MQNVLVSNLPITINSVRIKINLRVLSFFLFLTALSLFAVTILQLNTYTKEFYLVQSYEKKINQLTQENKVLEINFSQANSLLHIDNLAQNQIFVKAGKIDYIRILESTALAK
ncbi:MAG: hypothetical protein A2175_02010 [Candidatus Nealsonbacteria bacterium RBG_13_42_11]|uniref:Cell division protein FtsL n=1 Tax=Candidatus Nealsonbacteria bacterium RBG_13_42_11 TaxID=1801663 RepID=A0A1G2E027_9BACT|nr:MAG: hypothetical protein A2175_02010 [Candidatus Nealsonbacteria bacterium RBG_13_42_11]